MLCMILNSRLLKVNVTCRLNAAEVAEHFAYPRVISFLFDFCEALFGISVKVSKRGNIVS